MSITSTASFAVTVPLGIPTGRFELCFLQDASVADGPVCGPIEIR